MSRIRTPFNASIPISRNSAGDVPQLRLDRTDLFLLGALWIEARDAAAFGACRFVDDGVDERRLLRANGVFHCLAQFDRRRRMDTHAAEGFHQLVVARAFHEDGWRDIRAAGRIDVGAAIYAIVV